MKYVLTVTHNYAINMQLWENYNKKICKKYNHQITHREINIMQSCTKTVKISLTKTHKQRQRDKKC